jgi:DNA adenine methylase
MEQKPRSFLRWAGSKKQLLSILETYWKPTHSRYVEPFAGSACLFFRINPKRALLGDLNRDLISTYLEVKYRLREVLAELSQLEQGKEKYLEIRSADVSGMTSAMRAARFIYLNRFCFNGLYRTNLKGQFNVPYGGERSGELPSPEHLSRCSRQLGKANLLSSDFENVLDRAEPGDFVYMDPPFSVASRRVFKEYNAAVFNDSDLARLKKRMEQLAARKIDFLVSYAESREADFLSDGFYRREVFVKRNIAGFSEKRSKSKEVLISSSPH